jgi:hypothetical protein
MNRASTTRRAALALAIIGVVGLILLASACGGSSHANVAQVGTSTGSNASDDPNAYSKCMRNHGVGNYPDPDSHNILKTQGIDKNSPTYQAAAHACLSLAPTPPPPAQQAQEQAQMLAFAKCMRSHGVPAFPDPQVGNGGSGMQAGQIDPNSPIVKAAIATCRSKFAGAQKLVNGLTEPPQKVGRRRGS